MGKRNKAQKLAHNAYLNGRKNAEAGRVCVGCSVNDSECRWSHAKAYCEACARKVWRNGRCKCGRPFTRYETGTKGRTRASFCETCEVERLKKLGYRPMILISPVDDRERVIWRKPWSSHRKPRRAGGYGPYPSVMEATADEWKSMR